MEASALHAPSAAGRLAFSPAFLRLRSDDQLLTLLRAGHDEAFRVIHDRYRQRLFSYVRQMLGTRSRQDAEDVLQDVFVRAYGSLRADDRPVVLRAWLYRVAHNRCVDVLRRAVPAPADIFDVSRKPLHDPIDEAQRRDDLARLVRDVSALPEQQRSALLMREIDGVPYAEIADALNVTVPAVKSLLVRARMGLVEAQEARDLDCAIVRGDLAAAYDRGVKASARARRHMRECSSCTEYRTALRGMRRSFAALSPATLGPLALAAKALGIGSAGGGAAASAGGSAAGGAAAVAGGGMATATACKVAAVVCTAAIGAGGAVEVRKLVRHEKPAPAPQQAVAGPPATAPAAPPVGQDQLLRRSMLAPGAAVLDREKDRPAAPSAPAGEDRAPATGDTETALPGTEVAVAPNSGGSVAPAEAPVLDGATGGAVPPPTGTDTETETESTAGGASAPGSEPGTADAADKTARPPGGTPPDKH